MEGLLSELPEPLEADPEPVEAKLLPADGPELPEAELEPLVLNAQLLDDAQALCKHRE